MIAALVCLKSSLGVFIITCGLGQAGILVVQYHTNLVGYLNQYQTGIDWEFWARILSKWAVYDQ
jgi:hypothetical protein